MAENNIITGEGAELDLPSATVLSRIVSGLVDYGLLIVIYVTLLVNVGPVLPDLDLNGAQAATLVVASMATFLWLIPALVTALLSGRTPGKMLTRTRVVRLDGGTITTYQAFIRATVALVEVFVGFGAIATVTAFISKRGQRLGDMLAGTYVVRWPTRRQWEPKVTMPAELESWAALAQTRPLPTGLALNVADFLKGRECLTEQARQSQALALAAACEKYVSPPPPWGTSPEAFVEAVTVLRYDIELQRLTKVAQRHEELAMRLTDVPYGLGKTRPVGSALPVESVGTPRQ